MRSGCLSFVAKKDGNLRLILDCRPVNECCKDPPYSNLATPSGIGGINLSDEWFQKCESEDLPSMSDFDFAELGDFDVHAAGVDLEDGFYQFLAPSVSSWFGLGEQYTAREAGIDRVFDEDTRTMVPISPDEMVWACFGGLSMGWNWALFFCHEALSSACRSALVSSGICTDELAANDSMVGHRGGFP